MKSYHEGHCRKASCGEGHEDKIQRRLVVNEYGGYNISGKEEGGEKEVVSRRVGR
jgi:hypothetical protein